MAIQTKDMRQIYLALGMLICVVGAGLGGYQWASMRLANQQSLRERQLERELESMLSMLADIADHRKRGENDLANWKFEAAHEGLEGYIRDGGPGPTEFVLDIVEISELPAVDE